MRLKNKSAKYDDTKSWQPTIYQVAAYSDFSVVAANTMSSLRCSLCNLCGSYGYPRTAVHQVPAALSARSLQGCLWCSKNVTLSPGPSFCQRSGYR